MTSESPRRGRLTAVVLTALSVLVNTLIGAPAPRAQAQTESVPEPPLRLDVVSMAPRIVTEDATDLTLNVDVTNVSDKVIRGISARLHFGPAQTTADQLRQALVALAPTDSQITPFQPVADELAPGARTQFEISVDLRDTVRFLQPGVYPMLVNVNGTPGEEIEARLASVHLLLPVTTPPGSRPDPQRERKPVTVLWPIASDPEVLSAPAGGPILLSDDGLADEMRPGGRLNALVTAAKTALKSGKRVRDALCFAIDPAVVVTAEAMTRGYRFRDGASTRKGGGAAAAQAWLDSLREVLKDQCVTTMPYADADLGVTARTTRHLAELALRDKDVAEALDVAPLPGVTWSDSSLTAPALAALAAVDKNVVIADPTRIGQQVSVQHPVKVTDGGDATLAVPYDELTALALTPSSASVEVAHNSTLAADDGLIAAQNGVAALLFHARFDAQGSDGAVLVAPPRDWEVTQPELDWLMGSLDALMTEEVLTPRPLPELLNAPASGTVRPAASSALDPSVPLDVTRRVATVDRTLADLTAAMDTDPRNQVTPEDVALPVSHGLLRTLSSVWHDDPDGRRGAIYDAEQQLEAIRDAVRIKNPGRTIGLASGSSPIPVSIANELPVQITVRVKMSASIGLRPGDISDIAVRGGVVRTVRIPTQALRAGRFTVELGLTTPGGTDLAAPTRFELASTEFGAVTVIVTATAAAALLLLSGRRIYRRLRSNGQRNQ